MRAVGRRYRSNLSAIACILSMAADADLREHFPVADGDELSDRRMGAERRGAGSDQRVTKRGELGRVVLRKETEGGDGGVGGSRS